MVEAMDCEFRRQAYVEAAERLSRNVAGDDLQSRGCYVIDGPEAGPDFRLPNCHGWTSATLDVRLEPCLRDLGIWCGRGFACIVYVGRVRIAYGVDARASLLGAAINDIALHELAHWYEFAVRGEWPGEPDPGPLPEFLDKSEDKTKRLLSLVHAGVDHGAAFLRCAIHVAARACECGFGCTAKGIIATSVPAEAIERGEQLLRDEVKAGMGSPLGVVLRERAPRSFSAIDDWLVDQHATKLRLMLEQPEWAELRQQVST